jgi:hypothetical protein
MAPVSNGGKARPLKMLAPSGPMRHWHTVGLDIAHQVARLQSLTPLLEATAILPWRNDQTQPTGDRLDRRSCEIWFRRFHVKIKSGTQVASRGQTWGIATPPV